MCHICMYLISIVVSQYDASLSSLLDKHAPSKRSYVVEKPMNDWVTDDMLVLKALCRKYEIEKIIMTQVSQPSSPKKPLPPDPISSTLSSVHPTHP